MSIFGEVINPGSGGGNGRNDAQSQQLAKLVKNGLISAALVIAALIFFN